MIAAASNGVTREVNLPESGEEAALTDRVSASRLNCFHSCRLKFFFRYVEQIAKPATPALHVGKVVHGVLQRWNKARWWGDDIPFVQRAVEEVWTEELGQNPVLWDNDEEAHKTTAKDLVDLYLRETPIPEKEKPMGVEVMVTADLSRHGLPDLVGVMDLIRATPEGGVIVDFKTSSTTPNPEKAIHQNEVQLSCYGVLYRSSTAAREKGFELHHLVKTKSPKLVVNRAGPINQIQESRLYRSIDSYLKGVEREDYVPAPGLQCSFCEYFHECRAWRGGAA
jgi:hypothetical protein